MKSFQVIVDSQSMGDHRPYVQSALQHARHFVPGLEHFPAIDALDRQAFENYLVPIDRSLAGRNAEHGDAAAVIHGSQQLAQRRGVAGHFETDIEALFHA